MGLSCAQITLLTLTARKADCEYGIAIDSAEKMALTREMSELSSEYYSKLKTKQYAYYADGKYNKLNYHYLMGGLDYEEVLNGSSRLKDQSNMILTDYKGQVVLSDLYANAITAVLGPAALDKNGKGATFSMDKIPEMLAKVILCNEPSANTYRTVMDGNQVSSSVAVNIINTLGGNKTGTSTKDNSAEATKLVQKILDFYLPIFKAAAANGWTTEYNKEINSSTATNEDYISDSLASGTLQLATVNENGEYDEGTSMTYFVTAGMIETNNSSEIREEVTAWYEAEKNRLTEKENYLDMHMGDLSTELEAINTEIQSIQSFIDDAISSVFDWGGS